MVTYLEQCGSFLLLGTAYVDAVDNEYLIARNQLAVNVRHAAFQLTITYRPHTQTDMLLTYYLQIIIRYCNYHY